MKTLNWKVIMFVAISMMLSGLAISVYGLGVDDHSTVFMGLATIGAVCVSWWFWVMFIIRSMIDNTERTLSNIESIRHDLSTVKTLIKQERSLSSEINKDIKGTS